MQLKVEQYLLLLESLLINGWLYYLIKWKNKMKIN